MLNQLKDVFACLQHHDVKYVVIGGIAAVLHGVPLATFDLDLLIEPTEENAKRLLAALLEARLSTAELIRPRELLDQEITMFNDRIRIDVQIATPGLEFEEVFGRCEKMACPGQTFFVVTRHDLITSKRAAARPRDLEDVRMLEAGAEESASD